MLKFLRIKNLVLIEECTVELKKGLNILSGETGSSKTAFLEAIALVIGERVDNSIIRHGKDKASVEAAFDIEKESTVHEALNSAGIEFDPSEFLVLRREIAKQGRSRAFINCQMVPLSILQKIGSFLIDIIGQHSHQELRAHDKERSLLDLFCDSKEDVLLFKHAWLQEKEKEENLGALLQEASKRERILETVNRELTELENAALQEGEEETLFEEYNRLAHVQELTEKCTLLYEGISEIPSTLARYQQISLQLTAIDSSLEDSSTLLQEALIALKETSHSLKCYLGRLESDPARFGLLEERLKVIDQLKRKYGDPVQYLIELHSKNDHLENLDREIEEAKVALKTSQAKTKKHAEQLTKKRKEGALEWAKLLTESLRALNMPHAELQIKVESYQRSLSGEDAVHFWLSPNQGELSMAVKEHASGGELSRLLFAIKTTLAEKNNTPTLIFDEIDANVGGKTAAIIGLNLRELGRHRQVLCITHFPQVASSADHHLRAYKEEKEGRTHAFITPLDAVARALELERMLGK
ncbi:MAG: DNA repair protein RecN [Chlamydiota bacterium]